LYYFDDLQLEGRIRELSSVEERLRDIELRLEQERGQWLLEKTQQVRQIATPQIQCIATGKRKQLFYTFPLFVIFTFKNVIIGGY